MKRIVSLILVALVGGGYYLTQLQPSSEPFQLEEGYRSLFDGASLDGWRSVGGGASFSVDGDAIVGRNGPGKNTFLRTQKTYRDFSLRLQVRWEEKGNSGIQFRSAQREDNGRVYGYQYELDPSPRSWTGGIYDEARRGWLAKPDGLAEVRGALRDDGWNDVEIEARGAHLRTWINGIPASDIVDGLSPEGFIALQVHAGKQGVIRWRRIRIRELPPQRVAGTSLLSRQEWHGLSSAGLEFSDSSFGGSSGERDSFIDSRREFSDVLIQMTVPACNNPTIIRLRDHRDRGGKNESYAEVKVYRDRAEARLVTAAGERVLEPVMLQPADKHQVSGVTVADAVTVTIGEVDVMRVADPGLSERGRLRIQPARCGARFDIGDFAWFALREKSAEPLPYESLDKRPAPVLNPAQALAAFRIAPGFEIELVAAEPLVEEPVAMAWDEYGRLYVVELRGYMRDAYGNDSNAPLGQVVRLEDTDGDGRMDSSEVFLGGLVNARAVAVVNEGVLVAEPPHLWLCELPDRASLCDRKRRVGDYAVDVESNVEHMENGLLLGLDNWLYNAKSNRALRLKSGELLERRGPNRGQWGITRDAVGRLLYNHNSTWLQADLFSGEDLVQAGRLRPLQGLGVNLTNPAPVHSVRVNPGVNRAYLPDTLRADGRLNRATGVSGLVAYLGDQFPRRYHGDVFVPEVAGNVVAQFAMREEGVALTAEQQLYADPRWGKRDFLGSTDERFRPVDAYNGPDGALYVIDMYRGIVQDDHFLTDELREQIFERQLDTPIGMGRIWRIRHSKGKPERAFPKLALASTDELIGALSHDNGWVRDTAQRLLLTREGDYRTALEAVARGEETLPALHAIWTLQGRDELQRDLVLELAVQDDPHRQVQALRAGAALLSPEDLLILHTQQTLGAEAVTLQLALAMGQFADRVDIRQALAKLLASHLASPYVTQAVERAVSGRELHFLSEYLAAGTMVEATAQGRAVLKFLAANAYLSLRGDTASSAAANPALLNLLTLAASRENENAWQQVALLRGMQWVARRSGFVPAHLDAAPAIFTDGEISGESPLWAARMAARAAFTWPTDELALGITPLSPEQLETMAAGKAFYPRCGACHGLSGEGIAGLAPPLAGASWVTGPPEWLGRIILQGMSGPVNVGGQWFDGVMPGHRQLQEMDDRTLAGLMTYLRRSWGNQADPVSIVVASNIRTASAGRDKAWTASELRAIPFDRGYGLFVGEYAISFATLTITEEADGLFISVPLYGTSPLTPLSETRFSAEEGGELLEIEFVAEPGGEVNSLVIHRKGDKITAFRES